MNLWELKRKLMDAGVPESSYFLVGIDERHGGKGGGMGELVVARTDSEQGWVLSTTERGMTTYERHFATEDEACREAWDQLAPVPHQIIERTPEEKAQSLARTEERKREYEKATAEFRAQRGR